MCYSAKEIPNNERNAHYYETQGLAFEVGDLLMLDQFEILDPQGDRVTIVHSQNEADSLLSHLNR